MIPCLTFAAGLAIGLFVVAMVSSGGREDAYRRGCIDGREAFQRETLGRVWDDLEQACEWRDGSE